MPREGNQQSLSDLSQHEYRFIHLYWDKHWGHDPFSLTVLLYAQSLLEGSFHYRQKILHPVFRPKFHP